MKRTIFAIQNYIIFIISFINYLNIPDALGVHGHGQKYISNYLNKCFGH